MSTQIIYNTATSTAQWKLTAGAMPLDYETSWSAFGYSTYWGGPRMGSVVQFANVEVPKDATIDSAIISVKSYYNRASFYNHVNLYFNNVAVPVFPTNKSQCDSLSLTSAVELEQTIPLTAGTWYDLPDVASILQGIVNLSGWASGNILQFVARDINSSGDLQSAGSSTIKLTIVYNTPVPATSRAITLKRDISPILINQRVSAYKRDSYDKLQVRLVLNNKGRLSYLKNVPVEFYLNYTGSFVKYVDTITDNNGSVNFNYSCNNIEENINSCVGYVKVIVDSIEYTSNIVKFNFTLGGQGIEREIQLYPADIMLYSSDIINL